MTEFNFGPGPDGGGPWGFHVSTPVGRFGRPRIGLAEQGCLAMAVVFLLLFVFAVVGLVATLAGWWTT